MWRKFLPPTKIKEGMNTFEKWTIQETKQFCSAVCKMKALSGQKQEVFLSMTCSISLPQNISIEKPLTNETNTKVSDYAARSAGCGHSVGKGLASAPASLPTSPTLIFLTLQSLLFCQGRRVAKCHLQSSLVFFHVDFPLPSELLWKNFCKIC